MHEERGATIYVPGERVLATGVRDERRWGRDVGSVWVKGSNTGWISMTHNWGVSYQAFVALAGQSLSFKITSYATRDTVVGWHAVPPDWSVGLTYDAGVNFY
uniref:Expansin-like CBD domain-containing protein n=1 Tax=Ananas comosus var. bracteatus TaxID=296719 RepID=A0A6V7PWP2_ANACO|nr:unnamed protein product [Ananas comosus var. bracteatus]